MNVTHEQHRKAAKYLGRTYPQGTLLWPREPIAFKSANNHVVRLNCGDSVWVTNSQLNQASEGIVKLARSGKNAGYAWNFTLQDTMKFFTNGGAK